MSSAALPFLYVDSDVPAGLTLSEFRHTHPTDPHRRSPSMSSTVLRRPALHEAATVRQIALLDSTRPLQGEVMVAEVEGRIVAAVSLTDGRVVADPFVPSGPAAGMLRDHVDRLRGAESTSRRSPRVRRLRPRLVV